MGYALGRPRAAGGAGFLPIHGAERRFVRRALGGSFATVVPVFADPAGVRATSTARCRPMNGVHFSRRCNPWQWYACNCVRQKDKTALVGTEPTRKGDAMRQLLRDSFAFLAMCAAVAACCLIVRLIVSAVPEAASVSPVTAISGEHRDWLVVQDWDNGRDLFVRTSAGIDHDPVVAEQVLPEQLQDFDVFYEVDNFHQDQIKYVRDVVTGELRPATGLWCWPLSNGTQKGKVDGKTFFWGQFEESEL